MATKPLSRAMAQALKYGKRVLTNAAEMATKAATYTDPKQMQQRSEEVADMADDVGNRLLKIIRAERRGETVPEDPDLPID